MRIDESSVPSPQQLVNLKSLRIFLGHSRPVVTMTNYVDYDDTEVDDGPMNAMACGSSACLIGWAAHMFNWPDVYRSGSSGFLFDAFAFDYLGAHDDHAPWGEYLFGADQPDGVDPALERLDDVIEASEAYYDRTLVSA